jgi:hypothetical protein
MKKVLLATIASVITLVMVLPLAGVAMAQTEPTLEEATVVRLGLAIQAPDLAKVGQPLRIRVVTRPGERPVNRAQVWAININDIRNDITDAEEYASLAERCGHLLGWTNQSGYVNPPPRIWRAGKYVLVAIKPHFIPGFTMIKIEPRVPLTLTAPDYARVGQKVTMTVTEPVQEPVPRAAIFAMPLRNIIDETDQTGAYDQLLEAARAYAELVANPEVEAELMKDKEAYDRINKIRRYFIGFTDWDGELIHRFWRSGPYLLIAAKCGYIPDFSIIKIRKLQPAQAEPLPMRADETIYNQP